MNAAKLKTFTKRTLSFLRQHDSTEGILVALFFILFSTSALFLTWKVSHDLDPDTGKNWWVIAFESPKDTSSTFFIENHSDSDSFSYSVTSDDKTFEDRTISATHGEATTIRPENIPATGKLTISVSRDGTNEKKSIYKNFP